MRKGNVGSGWAGELATWLAQLKPQASLGQIELRTRRLVVVDEDDQPRMVAEVGKGGVMELRLEARTSSGAPASAVVFASPGDEGLGLPGGCRLQAWIDGNAIDELTAWTEQAE